MLPRSYTMIHVIRFAVYVAPVYCDKVVFIKNLGSIGHGNVAIACGRLIYVWRHNRSTAVHLEIAPAPRSGNMLIDVN